MTASLGRDVLRALQLIGPLRRQIARLLPDEVGPAGLTALRVIDTADDRGEQARVSDVATALHIGLPVASRQVRHLEDQGLLTREVSPDDRRAHRLELTVAGRELLSRVETGLTTWIDTALEDWPTQDAVQLASLLTRLHADISQLPTTPLDTGHESAPTSEETLQETTA